MNHYDAQSNQHARELLRIACAGVLTASLLQPVHADGLRPPDLSPGSPLIVTAAEGRLFRIGYAVGTQQYVCRSSVNSLGVTSYGWTLFGPQATLFKDANLTKQNMTHFQSSNPLEDDPLDLSVGGLPRPTWQDSRILAPFGPNLRFPSPWLTRPPVTTTVTQVHLRLPLFPCSSSG